MAVTLQLTATKRSTMNAKHLRAAGSIPAVVYGHGMTTEPCVLPEKTFSKIYAQAGTSTLIDLTIEGGAMRKVLIHEVQQDPLTSASSHVDLYAVRMDEEMQVDIPIVLTGVSPAVKELGGILVRQLTELPVVCLPKDLVHEISIDLAMLATIGSRIHARDLPLPAGIRLAGRPDDVIAAVEAQRAEEVVAEAPAADVSKIEVAKKGKEETAEGAEAGADGAAKGDKKEEKKKDDKK